MKAYTKDIIKTILKEKKRFVAIMVIIALGVAMTTGLRAGCEDLRVTGDHLFDECNLHDIHIQSTLGLTDDDIDALKKVEHVKSVEGNYEETVYVEIDNVKYSTSMKMLKDIDQPYLLEGRLPSKKNEVAVTEAYISTSNGKVGDTVKIQQDDETFDNTVYTITGIIIDPTDINAKEGATSFRSSSSNDYVFFTLEEAFDYEVYSSVVLTLEDVTSKMCYESEYDDYVESVTTVIADTLKSDQEGKRTQSIKEKAQKKLDKEKAKAFKKLDDAEKELKDAKKELDSAKKEIESGKKTLDESYATLTSNQKKLDNEKTNAKKQFNQAKINIKNGYQTIKTQKTKLQNNKTKLIAGIQTINDQKQKLDLSYQSGMIDQMTYTASITQINAQLSSLKTNLSQVNQGLTVLNTKEAELKKNEKTLTQTITSTNKQFEKGQQKITEGFNQYNKGKKEYESGLNKYNKGLKKYNEGYAEFNQEKTKAIKKLNDAQQEIDDIENARWYINTRNNISSYNNVSTDTEVIESLGIVFSIVFLIVAILIVMTTVNRMVEEDRGLIGTYQALGYFFEEIARKYMIYSFFAALAGVILGDMCGYVVLPLILKIIFNSMYQLPYYHLTFNNLYGFGAPLIFMISILITVFYTCHKNLKTTPASLMRPKAPKSGSRVFLERTPIWKYFSFLNKVTARNLFRYKKRLFMTLIGIALCSSLLVAGFGIKDSVNGLRARQYGTVTKYDLMAVTNEKDFDDLEADIQGENYIGCSLETVTLKYKEKNEKVQLFVFKDQQDLKQFIALKNIHTKKEQPLSKNGILVTRNASIILDFNELDTVSIQNSGFIQDTFIVDGIVENYLGNSIYMSESVYTKTFGKYSMNAVLMNAEKEVLKRIESKDYILTSMNTEKLKDEFAESFQLINVVVYLIIVMSGALAFTVLFTLSSTNISERERELATLKVLGFFDGEVHAYVNKETRILTILAILLGMPCGAAFTHSLTSVLKLPSLYFAVSIHPISYVYAMVIAFAFSIIVNVMTNKTLNKIDPVEALKSIE